MNRSHAVWVTGILAGLVVGAFAARTEAAPPGTGPSSGEIGSAARGNGLANGAERLSFAPRTAELALFPHAPGARGSLVAAIPTGGSCPGDMVEVDGDYCPYVFQRCTRWIDPITQLQCAEFAPSARCGMPTTHKRFCVDRFEWPNRKGEKPVYMKSWNEARDSCASAGKRLCTDTEWTLACEGPDHLPYPYGNKRNPAACNIDKPHPEPNPALVYNPLTQAAELARLDQREPSGARSACVSPYGAYDMAGNVDEWVVNESMAGQPFKSGLKGGYWGPVRTRCRPMTTAHEETFRYYQIGFRCCGEPSVAGTVPPPAAPEPKGPVAAR